MASTIHMKMSNDLKGESQDKGFEDQIEILHCSFSVHNAGSGTGTGLSKGKAVPSDFQFSVSPGASSTKLFDALNKGTHIDSVLVSYSKTTGAGNQEVYKTCEFLNCFLTSYSESGQDGNSDVPEMFSLHFTKIKKEYKAQATAGGKLTNASNAEWDYEKSATA